jgi:amidase
VAGLRLAWTPDLGDLPVQPEVRAVLAAARARLEAAGCLVHDAAPDLSGADETFSVLRAARMAGLAPLLRAHRDQIKPTVIGNIELGLALSGEQIAAARSAQAAIIARFAAFLRDGGYDALALPTVQVLPFDVHTEWVREIDGQPMASYIDWLRSCSRITVTAHPAVSIPAGLATPSPLTSGPLTSGPLTSGPLTPGPATPGQPRPGRHSPIPAAPALPVGLQLVGHYGGDRRLLQIAAAIMNLPGSPRTPIRAPTPA